jgi:16S rRNA (adenine1518-N6/adenine1519-N6)-dimethyltransferase
VSRQRLGQHFLAKGSTLERIARAACPDREPLVIEIGPGRGALTQQLLQRAARVVAIEIDPTLVELLREAFRNEPQLTVLHADALETDLSQWGASIITGNLPYYAATPIIEKTLASGATLRRAVFLVQKEVAARLTARPGTRDYGYLSVRTQLSAGVEALFDVPPSAFRPPPKVDSTVVQLQPRNRAAQLGIEDSTPFLAFVGLCFRQKRKTIRNNLAGVHGKDALQGCPEASRRAEELTLEEFAELYRVLYYRDPGGQKA